MLAEAGFGDRLGGEAGCNGKDVGFDMARKAMLVVVMILGLTVLIWAGVHNARERKLAVQAQQAKAVLIPKTAGDGSAEGPESMTPKLQGKAAPAFTLVSLDGKKVSLADYKGHPVFVNFWATWCEPCKLEMPWLEEFSKKYASQGLVVLGISTDDVGKAVIASTAKKLGVTYPILLKDDTVEDKYNIEFDPESFYVDKTGKVIIATAGISDGQGGKDEIEANIKKLIASGGQ
jgi:thiol-disulfide isomerase/thioredoxin